MDSFILVFAIAFAIGGLLCYVVHQLYKRFPHGRVWIRSGLFAFGLIFFTTFAFPLRLSDNFWLPIALLTTEMSEGVHLGKMHGLRGIKYCMPAAIVCIALGLLARFFMEYGEVSNTTNFTPMNLIIFVSLALLVFLASFLWGSRQKNS